MLSLNWLRIAEWFLDKGFSVIPLARCVDVNNCKRPLIQWDEYQSRSPSIEEVRKWVREFKDRLGGFAIVCGKPSGNLLVLGFEHEDAYRWFIENAPEPVKQLLENSMKVLTGVRSDGKRGVHVYVRLPQGYEVKNTDIVLPIQINAEDPHKKEPLNKVEVRFDGRYVVAPGYRHYSGVDYCIAVGPEDAPNELRCQGFVGKPDMALWYVTEDEAKQLIDYVSALARKSEPRGGGVGSKPISDVVIQKIIDLFRKYNAYREGFRNQIHFYLQGWLLKNGFDPDSIKLLSKSLATAFNDEEAQQREKLIDYQLKWLSEGRKALTREEVEEIKKLTGVEPTVMKGRSGLVDTFTKMFIEDGLSQQEANAKALTLVAELADVLGIKARRWVMIPTDTNFKAVGYREWLANYPGRGVILLNRRIVRERYKECVKDKCENRCSDKEDEKEFKACVRECLEELGSEDEECVNQATVWGSRFLMNSWIEGARVFRDVTSDTVFYVLKVRGGRTKRSRGVRGTPMDVYSVLVDMGYVVNDRLFDVAQLNALVRSMADEKPTYYATVLAMDGDGNLRLYRHGPLARHVRLDGVDIPLDRVAQVINELFSFYDNKAKAMDAYANALFQVFSFVRKQVGLRNKALLLYGEKNTGKTTIASVVGEYMFGLPHGIFYKPASTLFSPARLGRSLQYGMVVLFDEARGFILNLNAAEAFKNAVNDVKVYETATAGRRDIVNVFPAYAGMVITTQQFYTDDPGVIDRIYPIQFTKSEVIPPEKTVRFRGWLDKHRDELYAFGMYYIRTAIEEWGKVKPLILQGDFIKAARDYFAYVMAKLGISVQFPEETTLKQWEESVEENIIDKFKAKIFETLREYSQFLRDLDNLELSNLIDTALDRGLLVGIGIRTVETDSNRVRIFSEFVKKAKIDSLKNLYEHLAAKYGNDGIEYKKGSRGYYYIELTRDKFKQVLGAVPEIDEVNEEQKAGEEQK